jgi:hypothetical protein
MVSPTGGGNDSPGISRAVAKAALQQRRLSAPRLADGSGLVTARHAPGGGSDDTFVGGGQFQDKGGLILRTPHVWLLFWGTAWAAGGSPTVDQTAGAVARIVSGSYLSGLAEYRGISGGSLAGTTVASDSDPPNPFSTRAVADLIFAQLKAGKLPEPDDDPLLLYCVILPSGVRSDQLNVIGEHSYFGYYDVSNLTLPADLDVANAHFAWISNDSTLDFVTTVFSHALVEACTDPTGAAVLGTAESCLPGSWCEIGDVCTATVRRDGVMVQSYWSQQARACIVPEAAADGTVLSAPAAAAAPFPPPPPKGWFRRLIALYLPPPFFFWVEFSYLILLLAGVVVWFQWSALRQVLPNPIGAVPLSVPWFGALGAVITGLSGVFYYNDYQRDPARRWNPGYNFWHFARPFTGAAMGLVGYLILVAVVNATGSSGNTSKPIADVLAFLFGYREESFRELLSRATDLFILPGQKPSPAAAQPAAGTNPSAQPGSGAKTGAGTT